jgi:hypothetical protein
MPINLHIEMPPPSMHVPLDPMVLEAVYLGFLVGR